MASDSGAIAAVVPADNRARFSTGDAWGGLAAMLVALPSSIAYGVVTFTAISPALASAGALAGIIGAAAVGIIAPLAGRNGGFITAPCAPAAAVLSGLAAHRVAAGDPAARVVALLALTTILAALLQIVYGAIRAGRLIKFIPYQVVTGYLSGVALIIAIAQVPKLLGTPSSTSFTTAITSPQLWNWPGITVGIVTIIAMILAARLTKRVPAPIIALLAGLGTYFAIAAAMPELRRTSGNPLVIGTVSSSASWFDAAAARVSSLLTISRPELMLILGTACTLSVLLSIDTLKTGVVLDALTRRRHDSNRELIAQGVANAVSFFSGGMPGAGTMGPTLVNVTSGGRSLWSGVIEGSLVVAALLVLGKLVAWVPIAALAGILLVIAFRMFDFGMFRLVLRRATRLDFVVIVSVIVVAEGVGLIQASLVGVCLAILLFMRNQIRSTVILRKITLTDIRSKRRRTPEEIRILNEHGEEAILVQLKDDLFFGTTDQLFTDLEKDLNERLFVLLDFRRVQSMDYTAAHLFAQMQERLRERGGQLLFSGMPSSLPSRQDIEHYMAQLGLTTSSGVRIFETRDGALEWMEDQILANAGWKPVESAPPLPLGSMVLLRDLDAETLQKLSTVVEERHIEPGERLFSAGTAGDEIYFVRKGRIQILLPLGGGKRHHLATFCRGEFFGEMAFLDTGVRSADAEASTPSDLFVISRSEFDDAVRHRSDIAATVFEELAHAIAARLRVTDAELRAVEER